MALAGVHLSAAEVAALFGLSERRVNQLKAAGILSVTKGKGFAVVEAVPAYIEFLRKDADRGKDAKARKEAALADQAELNLAKRRGEIVQAAGVAKLFADAAANVKARLRNLPPKLAKAVQGQSIARSEAQIREGIDEALEALANIDVQAVGVEGADAEVSPPD